MSISFSAYLIEIDHLHRLFGCQDDRVRDRLLSLLKEDGKWDDESVEQAIVDIVTGAASATQEPEDYAAALEVLCLSCGELLPSDALSSMHPPALELLDSIPGLLNDAPLPLPLPGPPSRGYPTPFFISSADARRYLLRLAAMVVTVEDDAATEWLSEALPEYRGWLERAVSENKDLLLFLG